MKLTDPKPPNTLHGQVYSRMAELMSLHSDAAMVVGDPGQLNSVIDGTKVHMVIRKGPMLIVRVVDRVNAQILFDAYGT